MLARCHNPVDAPTTIFQDTLPIKLRDVLMEEYICTHDGGPRPFVHAQSSRQHAPASGDDGSADTTRNQLRVATAALPATQLLGLLDVMWTRAGISQQCSLPAVKVTRFVELLLQRLLHEAAAVSAQPAADDGTGVAGRDGAVTPGGSNTGLEACMSLLASLVRSVPGVARQVQASPDATKLQRALIALLPCASPSVVIYALLALAELVAGEEVCGRACVFHCHFMPAAAHDWVWSTCERS